MSNTTNKITPKKHSVFSHVLRFFGWWFGFSGLYAMFAVCPFCGQAGCPVGAGTAGLVGGFFALVMKGRTFFSAIASMFKRKRNNRKTNNHHVSTENQGGTFSQKYLSPRKFLLLMKPNGKRFKKP